MTGLVVTKLDGTAKGGVVFALAREFGIPIRYVGIGERPEDLRVFDAEAFVDALLPGIARRLMTARAPLAAGLCGGGAAARARRVVGDAAAARWRRW